jgi:hypothetical protein
MIHRERSGNAVNREELGGNPRILAGDRIDAAENVERPQGDVSGVAEGSCNHIEAGRQRRRRR